MLATIIRRLQQTLVVLLVMSALVFVGIYLVGDPVSMMASPEATDAQRNRHVQPFALRIAARLARMRLK